MCKAYHPDCSAKSLLIFDSQEHRFQKFVSDISGQDIHHHGNDAKTAVTRVRNWLRTESGKSSIPGGSAIYSRYQAYRADLPGICAELKLDIGDLAFADFSFTVAEWLKTHT